MMTDKPKNVRIATTADEDGLFDLLMLAYKENGTMPVSKFRVHEIIRNGTRPNRPKEERTGYNVIGVIETEGKLEAVLVLEMARMSYAEEWHLQDICAYTHKDHRRSNHANDLLEFGKWISEQMKLPLIIGILTEKKLEAKKRFYQRHVKEVGALFMHNPIAILAEIA